MTQPKNDNIKVKKFWSWVSEDLQLLARLHAVEMTPATIEQLLKGGFPDTLTLKRNHSDHPIGDVFKAALVEIENQTVTFDDLAADFAAIYLNGTCGASPNESPWIDDDELERQEPMFEVRDWYSKYRLKTEDWRIRPDDNLSLQLLFISHLIEAYLVSYDETLIKEAAEFMDEHILRWIHKFAQKVYQRAETAFYSSLAVLTSEYIDEVRKVMANDYDLPVPSEEMMKRKTKKINETYEADPTYYSSLKGGW